MLVAAEVLGTVSIDYEGMFGSAGPARPNRISVALMAAEGQHMVSRSRRRQHIEIVNNRMTPAFLTVQL